jgi:hypothetical protein
MARTASPVPRTAPASRRVPLPSSSAAAHQVVPATSAAASTPATTAASMPVTAWPAVKRRGCRPAAAMRCAKVLRPFPVVQSTVIRIRVHQRRPHRPRQQRRQRLRQRHRQQQRRRRQRHRPRRRQRRPRRPRNPGWFVRTSRTAPSVRINRPVSGRRKCVSRGDNGVTLFVIAFLVRRGGAIRSPFFLIQ